MEETCEGMERIFFSGSCLLGGFVAEEFFYL
jgi:hypothetical protein